MGYCINFQKQKRNYIVLTFDDEREVDGEKEEYVKTLQVGMPKKRVFTALMDMQDIMDRKNAAQSQEEKNAADRQIIDELYDLVAKILSNNLTNEKIATEWVEEQFSTDEIKEFFETYVKFVNGEAVNPN